MCMYIYYYDTFSLFVCRWEYLSVGYDIGFGLFFKRNDKKRRSRSNEVTTIVSE